MVKSVMDLILEIREKQRQRRPHLLPRQMQADLPQSQPNPVRLPLEQSEAPPLPNNATFQQAMEGMRDSAFLSSRKWQEQQWRADRVGVHPEMLEFERLLVRELAKHGLPFYAHCVYRSRAEQQRLFVMGHTRDSPDDGRWPHRGFACDVVHSLRHWELTKTEWLCVGHIGKELANRRGIHIKWGGDFKGFWDPAHWELRDWKTLGDETTWPKK